LDPLCEGRLNFEVFFIIFILFFILKKETNSVIPKNSSTNWSESLSIVKAVDLFIFFGHGNMSKVA